jgi:two-component system nitrogen regulation sensor histidine kinase GlnL
VVTPVDAEKVVIEFQPLDQTLKIAREEKLLEQQKLNRELIRNLAHEIKNPLGGIRGAAQLLERELPDDALLEYTQVIVKEADRLQSLMDRLLTPHRLPKIEPVNIHEILEYVRAVVLAEFPQTLSIDRDYDTSMPEILADREQLIQAMLNIARNAAQSTSGEGRIRFQTRIARQVTIVRERFRLALEVRICDAGPGVPAHLKDTIFYPLVTGRDGGTGIGLSLAQNFINQHSGVIEFESVPGDTQFIVLLPVRPTSQTKATGLQS